MLQRLPDFLNNSPTPTNLYRYILDFVASNPTPKQIAEFRPTPAMQERLKTLLERDQLTASEQIELDEYERIEHIVVMLKAGHLKNLTTHSHSLLYVGVAARRV